MPNDTNQYKPPAEDISLLSSHGFEIDESVDKRNDEDTVFTTDVFQLEMDDEDRTSVNAFGWIAFEPMAVNNVANGYDVAIVTDGDFFSNNGTWPDPHATAKEALRCYEEYFGEDGLLAKRGYIVVKQ